MYCLSYFYFLKKNEPSQSDGQSPSHDLNPKLLAWVVQIQIACQMGSSIIGTFLINKMNPKVIIAISMVASSLVLVAASYAATWWTFFFLYAFCWPLSMGPAYFVPVICAWEWFPKKKSTISGAILCGYGFGAFIFGFVTTTIANPENFMPDVEGLYFPQLVAQRVPLMIRTCAACFCGLFVVTIITVKRNPNIQDG